MPSIIRPTVIRYLLDGRPVRKGTPGAVRVKEMTRKWYACGVPGQPAGRRIPLVGDRKAAQRMMEDMVRAAERGMAGLPDFTLTRLPLADLIGRFADDVRAGLASRARRRTVPSEKQAALAVHRVRETLLGAGLRGVADLGTAAPARVSKWLHSQVAARTLSHQTAQFHLAAARRFVWWLSARANAPVRPDLFADVPGFRPDAHRVRPRGVLSAAEVAATLAAAAGDPVEKHGLSGPARRLLYLTAMVTGYRAEELSRLRPPQFALDADPPAVHLHAADTKGKRAAVQPLHPAVAAELRPYLAGRPAAEPVWPGGWWRRAAGLLKRDMAAAGVVYVADGPRGAEYRDFHALRHYYTSALLAAGADPKELQELVRHTSPALTLKVYAHAAPARLAGRVAAIPVPGVGPADPLAGLSRAELEAVARAGIVTAAALAALLGRKGV